MLIETYSMSERVRDKLDDLLGAGDGTNDGAERPLAECKSPFFDE